MFAQPDTALPVQIYLLPLELLPTLCTLLGHRRALSELPALRSSWPLALWFMHGSMHVPALLSQLIPLSFPQLPCVHKSVLCVSISIPALQSIS